MQTPWFRYLDLKQQHGRHFYPREGARKLGISECALMAANPDAVYLGTDTRPIVLRLKELGLVECIVRNSHAVHEKSGLYENVSLTKTTGIALNVGELDLRIFASHWKHALAVKDDGRSPVSYSIQFYDEHGEAIQKVFLRDQSKLDAWQALVDDFARNEIPLFGQPAPPRIRQARRLSPEELAGFQTRWQELKDIHHFGGLLETYGIDRIAAYEQAPEEMAFRVPQDAFEHVFAAARDSNTEIMIFVGNRGIVQIQTGRVHHLSRMHGWLNIMDKTEERFSMHLHDSALEQIWLVRRPTRDGIVTCVEGFDDAGETVLIVFGRREEGEQEQPAWQAITRTLLDNN